MSSGSPIQRFYLIIGGTLSIFYLAVGAALLSGRITFGLDTKTTMLVGTVVVLYGLFRLYMFYVRYRRP
jgi:hypothetical protein